VVQTVALPGGTVTLLFTDIEGSTRLLDRLGERYAVALADHRRLLRAAFSAHEGVEVDTQGDAFFVAFARAGDAVHAAVAAQRALTANHWPGGGALRVRMGIHTGEPEVSPEGYVGLDVHRGARICAAGHGGQILLSAATSALLADIDAGLSVRDLGEHRLKDLRKPEHLFQVVAQDLPALFPPLKSLDNRPTNLPPRLTPLVGRAADLAELGALLEDDAVRLVTLTGPGGSGKSRLSLEVAARWRDEHEGWTFLVSLASVGDAGFVAGAIADALGLSDDADEPVERRLTRHLREQRVLLLLDNFEHVLEAAGLVGDLLTACAGLKVLVTSRVPLHVSGEREYEVLPLPVDDAATLFVQRARAVGARVGDDETERAVIAEISERLDGLPLAIELAAARAKLLGPAALLRRLEAPLAVLTGGPRDRPERQRTLRATIDWSFGLLDADHQDALGALSVFAGGFTLDAGEAVAGASLDVVAELVDASLVRRRELQDGEPRLGMLETIRQFAREQLVGRGRDQEVARRHAAYFLHAARDAVGQPFGAGFAAGVSAMERDHDNLRAALQWSLGHDPALAVELAGELVWFWDTRGHYREGRRWLEAALTRGRAAPEPARARALFAVLRLAAGQGDPGAISAGEEALTLWRRFDDPSGEALTLAHLAWARNLADDVDGAIAEGEQAVALARRTPEDPWILSIALNNLSLALVAAGRLSEAKRTLEEALAVRRATEDKRGIAITLENLGEIALGQGDLDAADAFSRECVAIGRELGFATVLTRALLYQGVVALLRRDATDALRPLAEALEVAVEIEDQGLPDAVKAAALLLARRGQAADALALWTAAERAAIYRPPYDSLLARALEAAISGIGARERDQARRTGEALSPAQATMLAKAAVGLA
jgi:predicted ATPase/class 3 adenylate cyclase